MFKLEKRILFDSALPVEIVDLISQGGDIAGGANNLAASADGQFVVFDSAADNLVTNDTNGMRDVFLYDSINGTISAITHGDAASANADISADGNIIVFESSATDLDGATGGQTEIFQYNKTSGTMTMITDGNGDSTNAAVSADGTKIAFESFATDVTTNVVVDTNSAKDVFLYNGTAISMISINNAGNDSGSGTSSNADVANNGYVAFQSTSNNLVSSDTNGGVDVFLYDNTDLIKINNGDISLSPSISANGELIAFQSKTGTISDIVIYNSTSQNYTNITNGNISSTLPNITSGGEYISFQSQASNLVTGGNTNSDIYSYKISDGTFDLKSESTGIYSDSAVSANGEKVFFISNGKHHDIDTNGANDLFIDHFRIVASEPEPEPEPEEIVVVTEPSDPTITISDSGNSSGDKFDMDDDLERAVSNISTVITAENQDVNYFDKHNMATAFNIVNGEYAINFSNFVAGTDGNTDDIAIKKHKNLESAFLNQNDELKDFFSDLGDEEEEEDE